MEINLILNDYFQCLKPLYKKGIIDRDTRPAFFRFCTLFLADSARMEMMAAMICGLYLNLYIDEGNGERSSEIPN